MAENIKICLKCKQPTASSFFHKNKRRKDGLSDYCKECSRGFYQEHKDVYLLAHKENYRLNKKHISAINKKSLEKNREKVLLRSCEKRAKLLSIDFNLELSGIIIPAVCPLLGIPLTTTQGKGKVWSNASLDRIENDKGYVKGNVWVISHQANTMKNRASSSELVTFAQNVLEYFSSHTGLQYGRRQ